MKRDTLVGVVLLLVGVLIVVVRLAISGGRGVGVVYVEPGTETLVRVAGDRSEEMVWLPLAEAEAAEKTIPAVGTADYIERPVRKPALPRDYFRAERDDPAQTRYVISWRATLGVWVAAFFTLAIFSFLWRDNPIYKVAESVVIGVSAAYWMVVGFWDVIVPNLFGKIWPEPIKNWAMPGLEGTPDYLYFVPLILGVLLLWRLAPSGTWIARWPLAFIIGTTAGLRLVAYLQGDFLAQVKNGIAPVLVFTLNPDTNIVGFDFWESLRKVVGFVAVLCCLTYFFFSIEHKGFVGKTARAGIWFLMITFGAGFGYTVMGRIALLAIRIEFLADDWLWLIDPTNKRIITDTIGVMLPAFGG